MAIYSLKFGGVVGKMMTNISKCQRAQQGIAKGTASRDEFDAKSRAWYYAEILKNARVSAGITQQQLADKIGKKREYVAMLEKGETDMQLSTFIMISEAVGLKFALTAD